LENISVFFHAVIVFSKFEAARCWDNWHCYKP